MTKTIISFNYNDGIRTMSINGVKSSKYSSKEDSFSFMESLIEEVNIHPKKTQLKIMKSLQMISISLIPLLHTNQNASASILQPLLDSSKTIEILPPEIIDILMQLILACGTIAVALAMILMSVAGIYWMLGNKVKSKQWTEDIIKGFGQVLLAPVIILILASLTVLLFKNVHGLEAFF